MATSTISEVFVGICGLVVTVCLALPSIGGNRHAAREAGCMARQRTLGVAMIAHANQDDGWHVPPATEGWYKAAHRLSDRNVTWVHRLQGNGLLPTMDPDQVALPVPSLDQSLAPAHFRRTLIMPQRCPELQGFGGDGGQQVWSYNPSIRLFGLMPKMDANNDEARVGSGMLRTSAVTAPADTVLLAETFRGMPTWYPFFDHVDGYGLKNSGAGWDIRHGSATFVQLMDGHVERLEFGFVPEKTWPQPWVQNIPAEAQPPRLDDLVVDQREFAR